MCLIEGFSNQELCATIIISKVRRTQQRTQLTREQRTGNGGFDGTCIHNHNESSSWGLLMPLGMHVLLRSKLL